MWLIFDMITISRGEIFIGPAQFQTFAFIANITLRVWKPNSKSHLSTAWCLFLTTRHQKFWVSFQILSEGLSQAPWFFQTPRIFSGIWLKFWKFEALIRAESGVIHSTMLPTVSIGRYKVVPKLVQSRTSGSLHRDAPRAVSCCPPPSSRTFHRCRAPCHGSRSCNGVVHINTSDAFNLVINWQMLWPMSFVLKVEHLDTWGHFRPSPRLCHDSRHLQSPA